MGNRLSLGFAIGSTPVALYVLASLGPSDVLFFRALLLLIPGGVAAVWYVTSRERGPGPTDEEDPEARDARIAAAMRPRGPAIAGGCLLGMLTIGCLAFGFVAMMFSGLG